MILPRIDIKTIIIIVLAIIIFFSFDGCSRIGSLLSSQETVCTKTTTKTSYKVTDRSFQDIQIMPDYFKPTKVKVVVSKSGTIEVAHDTPYPDVEQDGVIEEVNKYEDSIILPNGIIKYKMLIRGELLKTDFILNTKDTLITKETETINTVVQSGLFGFGGSTLGLDGRIKDVQSGITYIHKNRWYLETGVQYDVDPKISLPIQDRAGILLKFGFKF